MHDNQCIEDLADKEGPSHKNVKVKIHHVQNLFL